MSSSAIDAHFLPARNNRRFSLIANGVKGKAGLCQQTEKFHLKKNQMCSNQQHRNKITLFGQAEKIELVEYIRAHFQTRANKVTKHLVVLYTIFLQLSHFTLNT